MNPSTTHPKTILITGASDGIGAAAARELHTAGHRVVIVGRSASKTKAVADELGVDSFLADYARLADVRALARDLDATYPRIDVLANNAGGTFGDRTKTVDGFEQTFQINHLATFLLTELLKDKLIASKATVIQTASVGNRMGRVNVDDLNMDNGYNATRAYGTAKLENILFTQELDRRYRDSGLSAVAFHPGTVATSFARESHSMLRYIANNPLVRRIAISPEEGARQLVWLATSTPGTDWQPGSYYEKSTRARRVNKQVRDGRTARELWERTEELLAHAAS